MTALTIYASLHPCPHCRAATIHALDDPLCALEIRLDPIPLTLIPEILALLQKKATYDLIKRGPNHHIIIWRDTFRITDRQHTILATHQCPGPIPATTTNQHTQRKAENTTNECPF